MGECWHVSGKLACQALVILSSYPCMLVFSFLICCHYQLFYFSFSLIRVCVCVSVCVRARGERLGDGTLRYLFAF